MRKTLATAALALGVAAAVLPVSSASAYCDPVFWRLFTTCTNPCQIVNPSGPCPE